MIKEILLDWALFAVALVVLIGFWVRPQMIILFVVGVVIGYGIGRIWG